MMALDKARPTSRTLSNERRHSMISDCSSETTRKPFRVSCHRRFGLGCQASGLDTAIQHERGRMCARIACTVVRNAIARRVRNHCHCACLELARRLHYVNQFLLGGAFDFLLQHRRPAVGPLHSVRARPTTIDCSRIQNAHCTAAVAADPNPPHFARKQTRCKTLTS